MNKEKILVVIPYLSKAAQGDELLLAVTGWRKHFKEDFLIVIVGDWNPIVDTGDDIIFIECPRIPWPGRGKYWAHLDHVNKFRKVREQFPYSKGFIYTCDDIYATRDFTLDDVLKPKVRCREIQGSFHHPNAWVRDNYKTRWKLEREGKPFMNWVCHLPVYYEWDKLLAIYDKYGCDRNSFVVEQLYFNTYFADSDYIVLEEQENDYQLKMWRDDASLDDLEQSIDKKVWICNTVMGWKPEMEVILKKHYGL